MGRELSEYPNDLLGYGFRSEYRESAFVYASHKHIVEYSYFLCFIYI